MVSVLNANYSIPLVWILHW